MFERAKDVIEQLAGRASSIDVLGERAHRHLSLAQEIADEDEISDASAESIELPDDEGIAGGYVRERTVETGPRSRCPGR
jgi:hypothetical protein